MLKLFLIKVLLLIGVSVALFIGSIALIPIIFADEIQVPAKFKENIDRADVILCGDSRADRQLDPAILHERTGLNVINIASSSQDLYTWSIALNAASVHDKILVISASYFQINDGANNPTYLSLGTFEAMDLAQKLEVYNFNIPDLILMQSKLAYASLFDKVKIRFFGNYERKMNVDYYRKKCNPFFVDFEWMKRHGWYVRPNIEGVKKVFLERAITNLAKLKNCRILIYNGPVSNSFRNLSKQTGIMNLEKSYDSVMSLICVKSGFSYFSFIDDFTFQQDELFYDPQHLCETGAERFSKKIASILLDFQY